jgi:hypothetical protein
MHPGCVEHLASVSPVQGVGVPVHVPVPFDQEQPLDGRHVALLVLDVHGLEVPEHVPVPLVQKQLLAERQVVLEVLEVHGIGVPMQVAVEDQKQLFAERQVVLVVFEEHGVGMPEQTPVPLLQVQPVVLVNPQAVLPVLDVHDVAVPAHWGMTYVQPLFSHVDWMVFAAQVVVGVPVQVVPVQVQPSWY